MKYRALIPIESRLEGGGGESSPKERAKTNHKRIRVDDTVICFTEVRFLQTYSPLRWSQR
jgi:hypothetical protein